MFSRNSNPSRVYDTLARFGTVSLVYPHQDIGWIVYFENEEGACEAESKISEIYKIDSIKRIVRIPCCLLDEVIHSLQPTDSTLYPEFLLDVISNPSPSSIIIAPLFALLFGYITSNIPDWIIVKSADDLWDSHYPNLRLLLLILGVIIKLCMVWVHFSAAKQNGPRTPG